MVEDAYTLAEKKRREAEEAARCAELEALRHGEKPIEVRYIDGDYLSGYTAVGPAGEIVRELGIGHRVSGWGVHVADASVEALGTSFAYAEALEYTRPAREAKAAAFAAAEAARQAKFTEARETGTPVVLDQYSDECNDPRLACDIDSVTVYAMPDGSLKTSRVHSY